MIFQFFIEMGLNLSIEPFFYPLGDKVKKCSNQKFGPTNSVKKMEIEKISITTELRWKH